MFLLTIISVFGIAPTHRKDGFVVEYPLERAQRFAKRHGFSEDAVSESFIKWVTLPPQKQSWRYLASMLRSNSLKEWGRGGKRKAHLTSFSTGTGEASVDDNTGEYSPPDSNDTIVAPEFAELVHTGNGTISAKRLKGARAAAEIIRRLPREIRPIFRDFARGMDNVDVQKKYGLSDNAILSLRNKMQYVLLPTSGTIKRSKKTTVIVPQTVTMYAKHGGRIVSEFRGFLGDAETWFSNNRQSGAEFWMGDTRIA